MANSQHTSSNDTVPDIDDIEVKEAWWVQRGLWALETCNVNSWESGKSAVLAKSKADVVFLQETRLFSDAAVLCAQRQAKKAGWNPTISQAHRTAEHHGSGGCAVVVW